MVAAQSLLRPDALGNQSGIDLRPSSGFGRNLADSCAANHGVALTQGNRCRGGACKVLTTSHQQLECDVKIAIGYFCQAMLVLAADRRRAAVFTSCRWRRRCLPADRSRLRVNLLRAGAGPGVPDRVMRHGHNSLINSKLCRESHPGPRLCQAQTPARPRPRASWPRGGKPISLCADEIRAQVSESYQAGFRVRGTVPRALHRSLGTEQVGPRS
jgi:hypothetical protein